ncbi:MAG: hypothetical protein LUF29_10315 [Oscillospiraceae bacterium]|nr:hypothetical protein [Oscillospiraceae bacterium]
MKMRKLMAVLLAVVVAISAMAISVFADDEVYTIDMYNYGTFATSYTTTYTIGIPAYALYGYATAGEYFTLTLPAQLVNIDASGVAISYTLTVNGVTVALKGADGSANVGETFDQVVYVGAFSRDYYSDSIPAMVPQSTAVANTTPITITATISQTDWSTYYYYAADPFSEYSSNLSTSYYTSPVITYTDANGYESVLYGYSLSCTVSEGTSTDSPYIVIVANSNSGSGSVVYTTSTTTDNDGDILTWDHTLANRATILNAVSTEGSTAKLVVVLGGAQSYYTPIVGTAVYTLNVYAEDASYGSSSSATGYWYSTGTSALTGTAVSTCIVNGSASVLEFDVPISYLYNSTYGLYNGYMTIQQTAVDTVTSSSYRYYNNTNWWSYYQLTATEVYLELTVPAAEDDSDVVVDPNVEDSNTETEDDGEDLDVGDDDDDEPVADSNPTTGIVLALVPMALAAAAAVASKRR